jgi:hypothetical protein
LVTGAAIPILDVARPDAARDLGVTDANGFARPTWSPDRRWLTYVQEVDYANGTHPGSMVALSIDGSGWHVFEEQPSGGTSQVIDSIDWQPAP